MRLLTRLFLIVAVGLLAFSLVHAQGVEDNQAIVYMAYEGTAEGSILIVSPEGYRDKVIGRDWFGSDSSGRYQREEMSASDDGRSLAISVRDTVDDVILWVPIINLDEPGSGNTLYPLYTTQAVRLGGFSPDGRYLALAVVGQESADAPLTGGMMVFDITSSQEFDEYGKWWLPLEPRDGQIMWAEIGDWTAEGVQFLPTCYDCGEHTAGEYLLWNPFAETITPETGAYFVPDVIRLKATGEALRLDSDEDFPRNPGVTGPNVVRYLPTVTPDPAAMTTIYADPRGIGLAQWVLDGQAALVQPANVNDQWLLIYRDGRVVEYPYMRGIYFVVGSTDGWFVQGGNADGYTDLNHIRLDRSDYLVSAAGWATVIRPPRLGTSLPNPPPTFQAID